MISRLVLTCQCGVCGKVEFKYRCPRCDLKTCSVPCISKH